MTAFPQMNQGFQPAPVQAPAQPQYGQRMQADKPKGPNVWYRPVSQADYPKISEMGTATIVVRILPGFNQNGCYESVFEKNVSQSKFPNAQRWMLPVLVCNDSLHPEKNGFVGIMEVSKTLHNRIKSKTTPANYFDFNNGFNFHINVSLSQSKSDENQWYPDYKKSGFEAQPTQCPVEYVVPKMQEGKFADFAAFVTKINNPQPKAAAPVGGGYNPLAAARPAQAPAAVGYTQPAAPATPGPVNYNPQATPIAAQYSNPTPPAPVDNNEEFMKIFGSGQ